MYWKYMMCTPYGYGGGGWFLRVRWAGRVMLGTCMILYNDPNNIWYVVLDSICPGWHAPHCASAPHVTLVSPRLRIGGKF
jgi:hypothetical protein